MRRVTHRVASGATAALALRAAERNHAYHETLHDFAERVEKTRLTLDGPAGLGPAAP